MRNPNAHFELQPWTTIKGDSDTLRQPRSGWLDAGAFDHAFFAIDIRDATNGATVKLETAMVDEDEYFHQMSDASASAREVNHISVPNTATTPMLRFVRWTATGNAGWSCTFRILALLKQT